MKFSTKSIAAFAAIAALSSTSSNAFSIVSQTGSASPRFGVQSQSQFHSGPRTHTQAFARLSPSLAATTPTSSSSDTNSNTNMDEEVQRLQAMAAKLRQEAAALESQQASERASTVQKAFDRFDTNQDGELSMEELKAALEKTFKLDLSEERVQRLMEDFDKSGDGKIQRDEFVSIDQFKNRLESLAYEEKTKALQASKKAQEEAEMAKLMESQLELINDKPPSATDKIVSTLPYLFPLMDGLLFGQFLLAGNENNPLVGVLASIFVLYRSIPLSGFLAFFALSTLSGNPSINRLVRFNMQQAIYLDIALFVPSLLGALAAAASSGLGLAIPPMATELGSDALFVSLLAILGYSVVSSLLGVTPDKVPFISNAVNNRVPSADSITFINPNTGEPFPKNKNKDDEEKSDKNNEKQD